MIVMIINECDKIIINVLEGSHTNIPQANDSIAYLEIKGSMLPSDIYKGDEIEIKIEIEIENIIYPYYCRKY